MFPGRNVPRDNNLFSLDDLVLIRDALITRWWHALGHIDDVPLGSDRRRLQELANELDELRRRVSSILEQSG